MDKDKPTYMCNAYCEKCGGKVNAELIEIKPEKPELPEEISKEYFPETGYCKTYVHCSARQKINDVIRYLKSKE